MKMIVALLGLALASQANANSINAAFRAETILPVELQAKALNALLTSCPEISIATVREDLTTMEETQIDQGIIDREYTTYFKTRVNFASHPVDLQITVVSQSYAISNPQFERESVIRVTDNGAGFCR